MLEGDSSTAPRRIAHLPHRCRDIAGHVPARIRDMRGQQGDSTRARTDSKPPSAGDSHSFFVCGIQQKHYRFREPPPTQRAAGWPSICNLRHVLRPSAEPSLSAVWSVTWANSPGIGRPPG